jgi:PAS domain S-box-containing protein
MLLDIESPLKIRLRGMKFKILRENLGIFLGVIALIALILLGTAILFLIQQRRQILFMMKKDGYALLESVVQASENALEASRTMDELLAQRLLTNARLIDKLSPSDPSLLGELALLNDLLAIDILDERGNVLISSHRRRSLPFDIKLIEEVIKDEREYTAFEKGIHREEEIVLVLRRENSPGFIVVYADIGRVRSLKREIGIGAFLQRLGLEPRIVYALLQDEEGIIFATPNVKEMTKIKDDPFLLKSLKENFVSSREYTFEGEEVFEVVKPFFYRDEPVGIFRLGLSLKEYRKIIGSGTRQIIIFLSTLFILGLLLLSILITNQGWRRLEEYYESLESATKEIFEYLPIGIVGTDSELNLRFINAFARKIFALPEGSLHRKNYREFFPDDILSLERVIREEKPLKRETFSFTSKRGESFYLTTYCAPYYSREGNIQGAICIVEDVTEKISIENRLRRVEELEALGNLAAGVAHEIRNPLNAISILIQKIEREFGRESEILDASKKIRSEIERINDSIEKFLMIASPLRLQKTESDILSLIDEVLDLHRAEFEKRNIRVEKEFEPVGKFTFDRERIRQVLINLVRNAIEAIEGGGTIKIEVKRALYDQLEIVVGDTGRGIKREDLPKIFLPYFTGKRGGTGIGLTIVHRIITAHRGTIDVESEPGKGTRFIIKLPYA